MQIEILSFSWQNYTNFTPAASTVRASGVGLLAMFCFLIRSILVYVLPFSVWISKTKVASPHALQYAHHKAHVSQFSKFMAVTDHIQGYHFSCTHKHSITKEVAGN